MIDPTSHDWCGDNTTRAQRKRNWSLLIWLAAAVAGLFVVAYMSLGVIAG